jgi:DNA-binding MarR family transcriptional regulator
MLLSLIPSLHRATHRVGLYVQAVLPGVNQGEAHVLAHLHEAGPTPISALHEAFAHRRPTLTGILDRLSERGLVRRDLRPEDRRSFRVSPTPKGTRLAARVHAALRGLETAALRGLAKRDAEAFRRVADALAMELLRSLEYYESHFSRPGVESLYVAPIGATDAALNSHLSQAIGVSVQGLDLNRLLDTAEPLSPEQQARSLLAIGAALRYERATL